jgi:hypothetical protein
MGHPRVKALPTAVMCGRFKSPRCKTGTRGTRQANEERCERVVLTPQYDNGAEDFAEFPDDPELTDFDRNDRKFAAVALASLQAPTVLNALDSDWADSHVALVRNGLSIRFLCPQHVHCP